MQVIFPKKNWAFPKFANMIKYPDFIPRMGMVHLHSTESGERHNKILQAAYSMTDKHHATLTKQVQSSNGSLPINSHAGATPTHLWQWRAPLPGRAIFMAGCLHVHDCMTPYEPARFEPAFRPDCEPAPQRFSTFQTADYGPCMQLTDTLTRRELSKLVLEKYALKATKRRGPVRAARVITACCATFDSGSLHD